MSRRWAVGRVGGKQGLECHRNQRRKIEEEGVRNPKKWGRMRLTKASELGQKASGIFEDGFPAGG